MPGRGFKTFPPGWGSVRVPLSSRRAAAAALSLYPACRPAARWARRVAWTGVRLFGPRVLPGPVAAWEPPMSAETWRALGEAWRRELGPWEGLAVYERIQADRAGFALLLVDGDGPGAFVKVDRDAAAVAREHAALRALAARPPRSFVPPEPIAAGAADGWHWLASRALPLGLHRPPRDPPLDRVLADVQRALADLPRPAEAGPDWRPMHGDFTPWNLRRLPSSSGPRLALVDWERAGWGPPHADRVLYRAVESALFGLRPSPVPGGAEAVGYWRSLFAAGEGRDRDARLAAEVARALDRIEDGSR